MGDYKQLIVWQKAHENTLAIVRLVDTFPKCRSAWAIGDQLVRAAGSRGANLAEGHGRQTLGTHQRDDGHFLAIAIGSAQEVDNWLALVRDAGFGDRESIEQLMHQNDEVRKMLYSLAMRTQRDGTQRATATSDS